MVIAFFLAGSTTSCTIEENPEQDYSEYGRTEFEKVFFDPVSRTIEIDDFTFAETIDGKTIRSVSFVYVAMTTTMRKT